MKYRMKCVSTNPQEPFFTEGKEYQIFHNNSIHYFIKDDDGKIVADGETRADLLNNLNNYWYSQYSQFELIEIEEPKGNKVLLTLDENKGLDIEIKRADEAEAIYMLMAGLIRVSKEVELEQEEVIETIKEIWGHVE